MPETNHREVLDDLLVRRDAARDRVSRVRGKLEAARTELTGVEEECKLRKVKPAKLGEAINTLEGRLDEAVQTLTVDVQKAEREVEPFLSEEST